MVRTMVVLESFVFIFVVGVILRPNEKEISHCRVVLANTLRFISPRGRWLSRH